MQVRVDEGELGLVRIFYSYSIKDQLKSSGFVFDKESASWTFPARLLADRLGLGSCADITAEKVPTTPPGILSPRVRCEELSD